MLFLVTNTEPRPHGPWHTPERHSGCLDHWVGQHMAGNAIIHPIMFIRGYAMYIEVETGRQMREILQGNPMWCDETYRVYLLEENGPLKAVLIGTGTELALAVEAKAALEAKGAGVRVVSMPCWELFDEQDQAYKDQVLPPDVLKAAIEAGAAFGWERHVGDGPIIGMTTFGASAPYTDLAPMIRELGDAYGAERLMWATDCPFQVMKGHILNNFFLFVNISLWKRHILLCLEIEFTCIGVTSSYSLYISC